MAERIIGKKVQTSKRLSYQPGEDVCACGYCTIGTTRRECSLRGGVQDWQTGLIDCCGGSVICTSQPDCAMPDPTECFIGLGPDSRDPLISVEWDKKAPNIKCTYRLEDIRTRDQIQNFNKQYGANNDLQAQYCTEKVTTCFDGATECSRLRSSGEGGNECRKWFETQSDPIKDVTMQNYCLANDTAECKCIRRSSDPAYQALKQAHFINDGCWYTPCANPSQYLVPSNLINPSCPDKVCQIIFDIIKANNVDINDVKNSIACDFNQPQPPIPKPDTSSFWIKYRYYLLIAGIVVVALIVLWQLNRE